MKPGAIFFDSAYHVENNRKIEKFIINLNDGESYNYIFVRTTTQRKRRSALYGCQLLDRYPNFYLPIGSCYFTEHTWIQLEDYKEYLVAEVLDKRYKNTLQQHAKLDDKIVDELLRCALKSDDLTLIQAKEISIMIQKYGYSTPEMHTKTL